MPQNERERERGSAVQITRCMVVVNINGSFNADISVERK